MEKKQEKKKLGLTTLIFISLLLGAVFGIALHYWIPEGYVRDTVIINGIFYVVGNGFLRAMQMLVVPLVFCSLVCGSMSIGDTKTLGKVGVKAMGFYLVTTALAITLAVSVANLIDPGVGMDISSIETGRNCCSRKCKFCRYAAEYYSEKSDSRSGRGQYVTDHLLRDFCGNSVGKERRAKCNSLTVLFSV